MPNDTSEGPRWIELRMPNGKTAMVNKSDVVYVMPLSPNITYLNDYGGEFPQGNIAIRNGCEKCIIEPIFEPVSEVMEKLK